MIRDLLGQSALYGLTTVVSRGANVFLLLALTLVLKPADFGVLSMILTISGLANVLAPLEITQGLVRLYSVAPNDEKSAYASTAFRFTLVSVAAWLAATELFAAPLCRWILGPPKYVEPFRIGLVVMAINSVFYFVQNQFRWEFRTKEYAVVSLIFSIATLGLAFLLVFLWPSPLQGILIGQAFAGGLAVAWGLWRLRPTLSGRFVPAKLHEMLRLTLPLVPASLAFLYSQYAGRFVLNDTAGLEAVGIFSFASQIAGIAAVALVGVQSAVAPLIMAHFEDPGTPRVLGRSFELFTGLGLLAALALGLLSPELIALAGNPRYASASPLVLLLSLSVVVGGMYVFLPGFLIAKKTGRQMWVSLAGVATSIGLNYLLSARFGAWGAAIATLGAASFFLTLWHLFSRSLYSVPVRWGAVSASAAAAAALGEAALIPTYPNLLTALAAKTAAFACVALIVVTTSLLPFRNLKDGVELIVGHVARLRTR